MNETQANDQADNFSIFANFKNDIPAGIAVFLVTLPLSLGIALASGAPLFAGLITGIVGGLVVAPISGSALGVTGAAPGLSLIVFPVIQQIGYSGFLLAVLFAGLLQVILSMLRTGVVAYFFPSSVTNGMLCGIGIILILKQIPHAFGDDIVYEGDFTYNQADDYSSLTELFHLAESSQPGAVLIAMVTLVIILLWEQVVLRQKRFFQVLQAPLVAVIAGTLLNEFLRVAYPDIALGQAHLVAIPVVDGFPSLMQQLHFPDFGLWANPQVYIAGSAIAVVASLKTLIYVEAIDRLDSYRRNTPTNQELLAQGIGNISAAMLGGLPLALGIVRSSVNVESGAKTKMASITNGTLLLLAIFLIPGVLNKIPLASLAAVLLVVGYKLVVSVPIKIIYRSGWYQFLPFCATVLGLVFTNILYGILIGLTVSLLAILLENIKSATLLNEIQVGNKILIRLSEHVSYLYRANLQQTLYALPERSEVVIDASHSKYIDYDVYCIIRDFKEEADQKDIKLILENVRGFGTLPPVEIVRPTSAGGQKSLTPQEVLELLKKGNERFMYNLQSNRNMLEQVNDTRAGQFPIAIILSCMDSRTSVELIFDLGLGDVFSARIAGNIVNEDFLGSMEFACKLSGSKLIMVLGHSHCGAIKGACANAELSHLTGLLAKIKPAIQEAKSEKPADNLWDKDELIQKVADKNVTLAVKQIRDQSQVLAEMEQAGEIAIVGGMYNIETGKVEFFDGA